MRHDFTEIEVEYESEIIFWRRRRIQRRIVFLIDCASTTEEICHLLLFATKLEPLAFKIVLKEKRSLGGTINQARLLSTSPTVHNLQKMVRVQQPWTRIHHAIFEISRQRYAITDASGKSFRSQIISTVLRRWTVVVGSVQQRSVKE